MNKKGFTLIELLAVIIILAVIALIATPIVLDVINDARESAAESSVSGYISAVYNARYEYILKNNGTEPASLSAMEAEGIKADYKGQKVDCGVVTFENGKFKFEGPSTAEDKCVVGDYTCIVADDESVTCSK